MTNTPIPDWQIKEQIKIKLEENGLQWKHDFTELLVNDLCSLFRSSFLALLESIGEEVEGMEKEEFIEVFDNSSHRYQILRNKREDWFKWCEIPEDDEASWDAPDYAKRIDGMPIEENGGYNQALSTLRTRLTEIKKGLK